jgi:hypothetical protein
VPSLFRRNEGLVAGRIIYNDVLTGKVFREDAGACYRSINVFRGLDPDMAVRLLSKNVKGCRQRGSPTTGFFGRRMGHTSLKINGPKVLKVPGPAKSGQLEQSSFDELDLNHDILL